MASNTRKENGDPSRSAVLMDLLISLVSKGESKKVNKLLTSAKNQEEVKNIAWDLVPQLCDLLTHENQAKHLEMVETVAAVLLKLPDLCSPKEMLLVMLEQSECFHNDLRFETLLPAIQKCLIKLPSKKLHSLAISVETLYAHVQTCVIPDDHDLETMERLLLHNDFNMVRINTMTKAIGEFLVPFIKEVSFKCDDKQLRQAEYRQVQELIRFMIKMCDHPMAHMDMSIIEDDILEVDKLYPVSKNLSKEEGEKRVKYISRSREIACFFLRLMEELQPNFVKSIQDIVAYNERIEQKNKSIAKRKEKSQADLDNVMDDTDEYEYAEKVPELGLSVFAYLAFGEEMSSGHQPAVYRPQYILQFCCPFIVILLSRKEKLIVFKGLKLLKSVLKQVPDTQLESAVMDNQQVKSVVDYILEIMGTHRSKEIRHFAAKLLPWCLKTFDYKGRYKLLIYVLNRASHAAVKGYSISLLKDEININLQQEVPDEHFIGKCVEKLFNIVFQLPDGDETDIMEQKFVIMGALNLLRFLVLCDKPSANATGIWTLLPNIQESYLEALQRGIMFSRAHYKLTLKKGEDEYKDIVRSEAEAILTSVTADDQDVSAATVRQQLDAFKMLIPTFDMLESLVSRVNELIAQAQQPAVTNKAPPKED